MVITIAGSANEGKSQRAILASLVEAANHGTKKTIVYINKEMNGILRDQRFTNEANKLDVQYDWNVVGYEGPSDSDELVAFLENSKVVMSDVAVVTWDVNISNQHQLSAINLAHSRIFGSGVTMVVTQSVHRDAQQQ